MDFCCSTSWATAEATRSGAAPRPARYAQTARTADTTTAAQRSCWGRSPAGEDSVNIRVQEQITVKIVEENRVEE